MSERPRKALPRKLVAWATLIVGAAWAASRFDLVAFPVDVGDHLWTAFFFLVIAGEILGWTTRGDQPAVGASLPDPAPAVSAPVVIIATGAVATVAAAWDGDGYSVPIAIAVATGLIASAAFRFARKHEGRIGEARFPTVADTADRP